MRSRDFAAADQDIIITPLFIKSNLPYISIILKKTRKDPQVFK